MTGCYWLNHHPIEESVVVEVAATMGARNDLTGDGGGEISMLM